MISSVQNEDPSQVMQSCDNADHPAPVGAAFASTATIENVTQATVQKLVQAAAMIDERNIATASTVDCQTYNIVVEESGAKSDEFLTETEFALLSHITTAVGDFDPLSQAFIDKRLKFVPVLEARGGVDKDAQGHRRDTLPIANAIDQVGTASGKTQSAVFQFLEENNGLSTHCVMSNDALKKYLKRVANGIIVRINPGTLSASSQKKCDDMLREISSMGVTILSHPDVASSLGAKDVSVNDDNVNVFEKKKTLTPKLDFLNNIVPCENQESQMWS
jgi:hypothetical protein